MSQISSIEKKLVRLAKSGQKPFGATEHQMRRDPCVGLAEMLEFEREHNVDLSSGLRDFLLTVTSGPVGPAYGLLPPFSISERETAEFPPTFLETPFPHREAFIPTVNPRRTELYRRCDDGEISDEQGDIQ